MVFQSIRSAIIIGMPNLFPGTVMCILTLIYNLYTEDKSCVYVMRFEMMPYFSSVLL